MLFNRKPYFMNDPEWYEEVDLMSSDDDLDRGYILTDKAPERARESYDAFYEMLDADDISALDVDALNAKAFGERE